MEYLFYDKSIKSNNKIIINNNLIKDINIDDIINDSSYSVFFDKDAIEYYNKICNCSDYNISYNLLNYDLYRASVYIKNINNNVIIITIIGINLKNLYDFIIHNKPIPENNFIKNLLTCHLNYTKMTRYLNNIFHNNSFNSDVINGNIEYIIKKAMESIDYNIDNEIDDPNYIMIKLHKYQKCSIYWMLNKEKNIKTISYNINDYIVLGNIYYDSWKNTFDDISNMNKITFYGGCLIDEVGLGKTVQMITLSLLNQASNTSYLQIDNTKLYSRATLIICPNHLCGQWEREIIKMVSKNCNIDIKLITTKRHFNLHTYQDLLDADFIIMSYNFFENKEFYNEWIQDVSKTGFKTLTKNFWASVEPNNIKNKFENDGRNLVNNISSILYNTKPLLYCINWHRIVIDEFHELEIKYNSVYNFLPFLKSTYKWCVTATPFINGTLSVSTHINFITNYTNKDNYKIFGISSIVDYMSTNFYRRNTKDSIKNEYSLPPMKEEIRWLQFSSTERFIYNAYITNPNNDKFSVYLRQLCCHPQLADETKFSLTNCKTLSDIEKMMIVHYKNKVDISQEKYNTLNERLNKIQTKMTEIEERHKKKKGNKNDNDNINYVDNEILNILENINENNQYDNLITLDKLRDAIKNINSKIVDAKKELDGNVITFNFFNNVVERIRKTSLKKIEKKSIVDINININKLINNTLDESSDETDDDLCGICLSEVPQDDIGVTVCGHIFCYQCLNTVINRTSIYKCPMCNRNLKRDEIYLLSYEKPVVQKNSNEKLKSDLINEVGTKIANLIIYLKESNKHTIIFSQWDDLLKKVGIILTNNNIKNVFCKGNCYQRDKAIREFNEDNKIKIIMLSSESAASGTNLTKADEIIMLDPIYGTYKYRKDQEKQAIGRAYRMGQQKEIKLIRFLIKNSIEEYIYMENLKDDVNNKDTINKRDEVDITD